MKAKLPLTRSTQAWLSAGLLLGAMVIGTSIAMTDVTPTLAHLDGAGNQFGIVVAGSSDPQWRPRASDWSEAAATSYQINLATGIGAAVIWPGSDLKFTVAVKNNSPRLSGALRMQIFDPLPRGDEVNPITGRYLELFDQLLFTVKEGDRILLDRVPATELQEISWADDFLPGDVKILDIVISMPASVDNRWQMATTDIQFYFETENL